MIGLGPRIIRLLATRGHDRSCKAIYFIALMYFFAVHCALPKSAGPQYEHRGRLSATRSTQSNTRRRQTGSACRHPTGKRASLGTVARRRTTPATGECEGQGRLTNVLTRAADWLSPADEWKTSDAKAPAFTCTRCWIEGGDPLASKPCPGVRMRPFNKSALAQIVKREWSL